MDEKLDANKTVQTGVLSSGSSAIVLLKEGPPDGGLEAWLQVFGAFFMYFNTWGTQIQPDHNTLPALAPRGGHRHPYGY